jgi:DNA-binding beta-propeller fold protein YncE
VQRLPNGHTFVTCRASVVEVDREGKEVFRHAAPGASVMAAQRLRDGTVAMVTSDGVFRLLGADGKEERSFPVGGTPFTFSSIELLPGGRVLVPLYGSNKVVEYDPDGKVVWEADAPQPTGVARLPGGNTLVTSTLTQRVVELDRQGAPVWEYRADFRLMRARRR